LEATIFIGNKLWTPAEITATADFGEGYIAQTLLFCKSWLKGQEHFLMQTSGSTGKPKEIMLHRSQMQASAEMTAQKLQLFAGTKALVCLHTGYIAGRMMLVRGLVHGWQLLVNEPHSLPFTDIKKQLDFVALVPAQLQQTLTLQPQKTALLNQMQAILVGGAAVSAVLENLICQHLQVPVFNTYGMTETVSHIALKQLNGTAQQAFFSLMPNTEIGLDDRKCLKIKSLATKNEWIQTNDLVDFVYENGKEKLQNTQNVVGFYWLGRADNVINSGGIKIQIEEVEYKIEKILADLQQFKRFVVLGLSHEVWGEQVILAIESEEWASDLVASLQVALKKGLQKYEIPKKIVFISKFEETETAKIDRKALKSYIHTTCINIQQHCN
jgi:O-succinylbenzoic acid--CoA ligase